MNLMSKRAIRRLLIEAGAQHVSAKAIEIFRNHLTKNAKSIAQYTKNQMQDKDRVRILQKDVIEGFALQHIKLHFSYAYGILNIPKAEQTINFDTLKIP